MNVVASQLHRVVELSNRPSSSKDPIIVMIHAHVIPIPVMRHAVLVRVEVYRVLLHVTSLVTQSVNGRQVDSAKVSSNRSIKS